MYLMNDHVTGYDKDGQQYSTRGKFLLLVQPKGDSTVPIKACVRSVTLRQCGHWMMGFAMLYRQRITVSGAYGADGLICDVPQEVYDKLRVELPKELCEAWNKGDGWNSAGKEAPAMRQWALQNLSILSK